MSCVKREPNFIVGGTAAGGTSFLSAVLVQHPQIYLPKEMRPEPHYFYKSWEFEKGLDYYHDRWFADVPATAIAVGERSSSYLFGGSAVAQKIAAVYPGMKFVFTLRNPVERTWANYRYTVLQGLEDLSFEQALAQEADRVKAQSGIWAEIQPLNYTGRGFYGAQLAEYLDYFPAEQLLSVKSELLSSRTADELRKVYGYLGLTNLDFEASRPPDHTSVNVIDPALQKELRAYFGDRFDKVIEATRKNERIEDFIASPKDDRQIARLSENMKGRKEDMPAASRAYLQQLFADDIRRVAGMVDFDVSDWR